MGEKFQRKNTHQFAYNPYSVYKHKFYRVSGSDDESSLFLSSGQCQHANICQHFHNRLREPYHLEGRPDCRDVSTGVCWCYSLPSPPSTTTTLPPYCKPTARRISWGCQVSCCRVENVDSNVIKLLRPNFFLSTVGNFLRC